MEYYEKVKGKSIDFLKDDPQFRADLLWFFSGNRYGYTPEDVKKKGLDGILADFSEHMRFQDTNEGTAVKDLSHIRDEAGTSDREREAWGRLMLAWDNADSGSTGGWTKALDYGEAVARSPSTWLGVISAGFAAPMSKISAKAAAKATQMAIRSEVAKTVARQAVAKNVAKESMGTAILKGGTMAAIPETALGFLHSTKQAQAREESVKGYERDPVAFWANIGLQGAIGFGIGSAARGFKVSKQNAAIDLLQQHHVTQIAKAAEADKLAEETLKSTAKNPYLKVVTDSFKDPATIKKKPLDEEMVASGMEIKENIFEGDEWIASVSPSVMKRVSASVMTILDGVKVDPSMRVTEAIARGIEDGTISTKTIKETLDLFQLNQEQFSTLFVAEFSQAGRTLAVASQLSKAAKGKNIDQLTNAFRTLSQTKVVSPSVEEIENLARSAKIEAGVGYGFLRDLDSFRIGMLTSQPATTAANIVSSVARLGVDASDRFWDNLYSVRAFKTGNPFKGTLTAFWGMTLDAEQADLMYLMLSEEAPETVKRIFKSASRVEVDTGSNSRLSQVTRAVNYFNTAADYNFKQAIFYSSIDRQLMDLNNPDLGGSFKEYSNLYPDLSSLPEGFIEKARDDALRFTYQYGYEGAEDVGGKLANRVIRVSKEVPFSVTTLIPFPRYVANQLEFIHDYTPLVNLMGPVREMFSGAPTGGKTTSERMARGTTGLMMFMSAYGLRASQEGRTNSFEIEASNGEVVSLERVGGPYNTMLVLAEAVYRYQNDKGVISKEDANYLKKIGLGEALGEAAEAATGVGFAGFNRNLAQELIASGNAGEWTVGWQEAVGDLLAGFTYPAAAVKDYLDQIDPERASNPYLRNALRGENVNLLGPLEKYSILMMRAERALPDVRWVQYLQSLDGETDIPLYNPFNPLPVRTSDPLEKQVTGFGKRDASTELQVELSKLGIKEWQAYSKRYVDNATVDLIVRMDLAATMHQKFEEGLMKDEVYANTLDPDQRKVLLEDWIGEQILLSKTQAEKALEHIQNTDSRLYSSYIRNAYDLQVKTSKIPLDSVVEYVTQGKYQSADEYLMESEDIPDELSRRQTIMMWVDLSNKSLDR